MSVKKYDEKTEKMIEDRINKFGWYTSSDDNSALVVKPTIESMLKEIRILTLAIERLQN